MKTIKPFDDLEDVIYFRPGDEKSFDVIGIYVDSDDYTLLIRVYFFSNGYATVETVYHNDMLSDALEVEFKEAMDREYVSLMKEETGLDIDLIKESTK